jgi:transposase
VDREKQSAFCQKIKAYEEAGKPIVSLDESGFAHDMPRTHGYALRGKRCYGVQDWGAKGRTNVIGALLKGALLTVTLFSTTINTQIFDAWVIQDLIPKLPRSSVAVMDNAAFHKGPDMLKALEDAGHTLLDLPPYSPDLNTIEKKWAQAKKLRRRTNLPIESLFNG